VAIPDGPFWAGQHCIRKPVARPIHGRPFWGQARTGSSSVVYYEKYNKEPDIRTGTNVPVLRRQTARVPRHDRYLPDPWAVVVTT